MTIVQEAMVTKLLKSLLTIVNMGKASGDDIKKLILEIKDKVKEEYNVEFYKKVGFKVIDEEEEHEGLTFVTLMKKVN